MKVAVIGSGLAGLTTAYLLRKEGVEVYLIERSPVLGFHSESLQVEEKDEGEKKGREGWVVNVPMRGFQGGYYPLLISLYTHLQLPIIPQHYTYSFSSESGTYFIHSGASGWSIPSLPSKAFTGPFNLLRALLNLLGVAISYLLLVVLSFLAWHDILPSQLSSPDLTVGQFTTHLSSFLARPLRIPFIGWSPKTPLGSAFESFMRTIVLPLFSAVGTMTHQDVFNLPVRILLEYIHVTLGTAHYRLGKGLSSGDVTARLVGVVEEQGEGYVNVGTEVRGLEYAVGGGVRVKLRRVVANGDGDGGGNREGRGGVESLRVDKVVLATQASVARPLLEDLEANLKTWGEEKERRRVRRMAEALQSVRYRETIVINHRDTSLLPSSPDRRSINLHLPSSPSSSSSSSSAPPPAQENEGETPFFHASGESVYTMATEVIVPPQGSSGGEVVLQTTNPVVPIAREKVLSVSRLERALALKDPLATLQNLQPHSPNALIYLAGSYVHPGIPLLEGCVASARKVVEGVLEGDRYHHVKTLREGKGRGEGKDLGVGVGRKVGKGGIQGKGKGGVGGVDWSVGEGSKVGRVWRWRWNKESFWC
ncbi:hypothetical protein I350_01020 [Cryptococcus amylolentus CBS 6273]|uniref:Amine oxidase domain-containing protein n=1 Tax=Cryptococcus amylolentus CBS 6273 TaxID=1296118 RepID=A0A1E3KBL5_9TREE|nr:hypothetical protein I350_01020 [Cryptococcus amylolentus CBS 6273]